MSKSAAANTRLLLPPHLAAAAPRRLSPDRPLSASQSKQQPLRQRSCEQSGGLKNAVKRAVPKIGTPNQIQNRKPAANMHCLSNTYPQPLARDADLFRPNGAPCSRQHVGYFRTGDQL